MTTFFGIQKVGEGEERKEHDIPIAIPYHKLLEWLLDRKFVAKTWAAQAAACRKEAREVATLPVELRREEWDYWAVQETMETLLARPQQDLSKGLFGGYNDPLLYRWSALVDSYQKNWCHVAECAQAILQHVKYDIPNQRKQVERIKKQLLDLEKRESQLQEDAASFTRQYERSCAQLGISGDSSDITAELGSLVQKLPQHYEQIALDYYGVFCGYTAAVAADADAKWAPQLVCPTLSGNTSRLQYERALDPDKWAAVAVASSAAQHEDVTGAGAIEIDWNAGTADQPLDDGDWKIEVEAQSEGVQSAATGDAPVVLDYVHMEAAPVAVTAASSSLSHLAGVYEHETVLGSRHTRTLLLDDLHELAAFVASRLREKISNADGRWPCLLFVVRALQLTLVNMASVADVLVTGANCPDLLRTCDAVEALQTLRDAVASVLRLCEQPLFVQLLEIEASKRYVARLAASVRKKLEMAQQLLNQVEGVKDKRRELQREMEHIRPQLAALSTHSIKVQKWLEAQLSAHFKGRVVQLTGDINNLSGQ